MQHRNQIEFEVWGNYGLFSDPVMRMGGEKCTLQIPTYEALKGIAASIYWKPTITWVIDAVRIKNQIQTETRGACPIKYNEKVEYKKHDLSYYTYLKDCKYQVRAHFVWNENRPELVQDRNENKHHNIAKRMLERGGRRDIFLGTRECQGYVAPCVFGEGVGHYDDVAELAFGLMYHGLTYPDEAYSPETKDHLTVRFWYPVMRNGVVEFLPPEQCSVMRTVREMEAKPFGQECGNFIGLEEFPEEVD